MRFSRMPGGCMLSVTLLFTTPGFAQQTKGRFQLGLSMPVISYSKLTADVGQAGTDFRTTGKLETSNTVRGIANDVALELGYGLSAVLVLGAIARAGDSSISYDTTAVTGSKTDLRQLSIFVGPKLDLVFSPQANVRPWVGVAAGYMASSSKGMGVNASETGFELQGRAGLRCFVADAFSIEPTAVLGWATVAGDFQPPSLSTKVDITGTRIGFALLLGASGWL